MMPLYLIVGRTCSGKDTIVRLACEQLGGNQLLSYTTRPRRAEEENVDTHVFVDDKFFKGLREEDIAASTQIGQYYYWSTMQQMNDQDIWYYIIDPNGISSIDEYKNKYHTITRETIPIYVYAPYEVRQSRWMRRSNDVKEFIKRDIAEDEQFSAYEETLSPFRDDHIILSSDIEGDFKKFCDILQTTYRGNYDNTLQL